MSYLLIVSTFVQFLKWPVALTALAFLPSAVWALGYQITNDVLALALVLSGAAAYALVWWWQIRRWTVSGASFVVAASKPSSSATTANLRLLSRSGSTITHHQVGSVFLSLPSVTFI